MAVEADPPRMLAQAARLTPSNHTLGPRTVATVFGGLDRSDNVCRGRLDADAGRPERTSERGAGRGSAIDPAVVAVVGLQVRGQDHRRASGAGRRPRSRADSARRHASSDRQGHHQLRHLRRPCSGARSWRLRHRFLRSRTERAHGRRTRPGRRVWRGRSRTRSSARFWASTRPILDVASKSRLHKRHGAVAVDMESHVAALAASAHGLPLVVVRAVADDATCALDRGRARRTARGRIGERRRRSRPRCGRQPRELAPLIRLAVRTGSARAALDAPAADSQLGPGNAVKPLYRPASIRAGRLRGERREPRADRLEHELVRLGGDILERGRVREHRTGAFADVALGRHLRKVHVAQDVGRALLGVGQLSMELREAPGAEHRRDGAGDPLGVEAVGDLGRGAPNDLRSRAGGDFPALRPAATSGSRSAP